MGTGANLKLPGKRAAGTTSRPVAQTPITVEQLAECLGQAGRCLIIEDLHKVSETEAKHVAEAMKLFMDLASDYGELRMIVLGARETASDILRLDNEMKNRVAEIAVTPMTLTELKDILSKGEKCLNVSFKQTVADEIAALSCGLPAVTHSIALKLCFEAGVEETVPREKAPIEIDAGMLVAAIRIYVEDQAATFRDAFEAATRIRRTTKHDNYRLILRVLSLAPEGLTRVSVLKSIQRTYPVYFSG